MWLSIVTKIKRLLLTVIVVFETITNFKKSDFDLRRSPIFRGQDGILTVKSNFKKEYIDQSPNQKSE